MSFNIRHASWSREITTSSGSIDEDTQFFFADVNADQRADKIFWRYSHTPSGGSQGDVKVYLSNGSGGFDYYTGPGYSHVSEGSTVPTTRFYFADVNGDGAADKMIWVPGNAIDIHLADGNGGFAFYGTTSGSITSDSHFYFADVDGDTCADKIFWRYNHRPMTSSPYGDIKVYLANCNGGFDIYTEDTVSQGSDNPLTRLYFSDVDGDGSADKMMWTPGNPMHVFLADGNGGFSYHGTTSGSIFSDTRFYFADVDGRNGADKIYWNPNYTPKYTSGDEYSFGAQGHLLVALSLGDGSFGHWLDRDSSDHIDRANISAGSNSPDARFYFADVDGPDGAGVSRAEKIGWIPDDNIWAAAIPGAAPGTIAVAPVLDGFKQPRTSWWEDRTAMNVNLTNPSAPSMPLGDDNFRRSRVIDQVLEAAPHIIGFQEVRGHEASPGIPLGALGDPLTAYSMNQLQDLIDALGPEYDFIAGSENAYREASMVPIFWRKDFVKVSSGVFFLPDDLEDPDPDVTDPEPPNDLYRIGSWVKLDREGIRYFVVNVHFVHDEPGELRARVREVQARKVLEVIAEYAAGIDHVVVLGDFNIALDEPDQHPPYDVFTACYGVQPPCEPFVDTYLESLGPTEDERVTTFDRDCVSVEGCEPNVTEGLYEVSSSSYSRLDYIFARGFSAVAEGSIHSERVQCGVQLNELDGSGTDLYASDHFPISARLLP